MQRHCAQEDYTAPACRLTFFASLMSKAER